MPQSEPWATGAPPKGAQPMIGATLLLLDESMDMSRIVRALKARGMRPVMIPAARGALELVSRWQPEAVILQAGGSGSLALLRFLDRRGIPCVLLGATGQLRRAGRRSSTCVHLLVPVEPDEVAQAAQLVMGPASAGGLPEVIDLGIVKIDLPARTVEVEGDRTVLPPKELEILVQLALHPGAPLDASELLVRVWSGSESATVDDLHVRIWRLRRMIGDHRRSQPLIVNRRGYGYLLDTAEPREDC
jgi:DNA-binding response OmpR family regulator